MYCPTNDVSRAKSPDDEENIHASPLQPQPPPLSKSPPPTPSLKESRTLERDRQRLKKAAALFVRRARKAEAKAKAKAQVHVKPQQQQQSTWKNVGAWGRVDDSGDDELGVEESQVEWGEARSLSLRVGAPEDAERERESARRAEVTLSDLLIARKPRRGREQDFEVVPPIRSVIVLDDITTPELDVDEPWEHVYASDADDNDTQNHHTELSYAKIVALSYLP
ncbi:hypothetical protein J132_11032 [Termitomyces sp. J132]|nr:hypothetical protein H2248_001458 [Termitomyces sp. 'cryptogamus']KNZ81678.1 hypothetical protein J132_11032 [Termitomyces sp. J132]